MRYYVYDPLGPDYECYLPEMDICVNTHFRNGVSTVDTWEPIDLRLLDDPSKALLTDFPGFAGHIPIFSVRAWEVLKSLIEPNVEILSVHGLNNKPLFAINVLRIIQGAIDLDQSDCVYNAVTKSVSAIYKYQLREELIDGNHMFKLHETRGLKVYVSEQFKEATETANLTGLGFSEIWPCQST